MGNHSIDCPACGEDMRGIASRCRCSAAGRRTAELEAENAALKAEVEELQRGLAHKEALTESWRRKCIEARASLDLAEAVAEAADAFWDTARDDDTMPFKVILALNKWRAGTAKS